MKNPLTASERAGKPLSCTQYFIKESHIKTHVFQEKALTFVFVLFALILSSVAPSDSVVLKPSTTRNIPATEIHTTAHRPLGLTSECNTHNSKIYPLILQ